MARAALAVSLLALIAGCRLGDIVSAKRPNASDDELARPLPGGAVPTNVERVSGNDQSAVIGQSVSQPYIVRVTDQKGDPIGGVRIRWDVQGGGSASPASATTDASGISSTMHTLGSAIGAQSVTAVVVDATNLHTTFTSLALPGEPAEVRFTTQPTNTEKGKTIKPAVTVLVTDQYGNPISDERGAVSITLAPGSSRSASFLKGTLRRVPVDGVATFSDLRITREGNYFRLRARVGNIWADSAPFAIEDD